MFSNLLESKKNMEREYKTIFENLLKLSEGKISKDFKVSEDLVNTISKNREIINKEINLIIFKLENDFPKEDLLIDPIFTIAYQDELVYITDLMERYIELLKLLKKKI